MPCISYYPAGAIESMFYEPVLKRCQSVAIPIVYGRTSKGKSNLLKICLSVCNNLERGFTTHLTESSSRQKLSGSLPFVYDDPSSSEMKFKQMLVECFGGALMENARESVSARCVPLISANFDIIEKLTADVPR